MRLRNYNNDKIKKMYFSSPEVSSMLGESIYTIHWWLKCFRIKTHRHRYRMFSRKAVARLHHVKRMVRDQKMKNWEVKERLDLMIQNKLA